jgi:alginate O-acetyltransferase complex protein AlgI
MVFSSPVFLFLFLPIILLLVALVSDRKAQNTVLLVASLFFYAWGEGVYVLLMLGTALFNHVCGLLIASSLAKRSILVFAVVANVGTLVIFKYANFLVDGLNLVLKQWGAPQIDLAPVHLPIGISFFLFHSLSYVVDVYRGKAVPQRSPGITSLYIALFPQLVAGPIVRYHDVATQLTERTMDVAGFAYGVRRFIVGLAKKVLIADLCARIADPIFALSAVSLTPSVAWLGLVAYAVQIYFDFSGYSDMAIGLGRMFGFHFLENFHRPYSARSLREFWKRWHISLTNFFRDYLYIPLGGNRLGTLRTYVNLLLVFFLTGLWHGASWNFVIWGMVHGTFMTLERVGLGKRLERMPAIIGQAYTLLVVLMAWAFFRCTDPSSAWRFISTLWLPGHGDPSLVYPAYYLTNDVGSALAIGIFGGLGWYDHTARAVRAALAGGTVPVALPMLRSLGLLLLMVLVAMAVATRTFDPFIYFRF